ncbi:2925_t:CDS:10, partial [Scutellospora calospora]
MRTGSVQCRRRRREILDVRASYGRRHLPLRLVSPPSSPLLPLYRGLIKPLFTLIPPSCTKTTPPPPPLPSNCRDEWPPSPPPSPASPSSRQRGKTIDDDAIPNNLVSPAKLVALREKKSLGHSRSSSDLRRVPEDASYPEEANATDNRGTTVNDASTAQDKSNGAPKTPPRPSFAKLRRRSTLEWANASPQSRQEKLESMTTERMADVFFSLHIADIEGDCSGLDKECQMAQLAPVTGSGPQASRIAVLGQASGESRASTACERDRLSSIRRSVHDIYVFGSIRTASLDDSIQDALATRNKIAAELEAILEENRIAIVDRDRVAEAEDRLKTIEYAKKTVAKQLEKARAQTGEKRASLNNRRDLMSKDNAQNNTQAESMQDGRSDAPKTRTSLAQTKKDVQNQRRRVCEDLQKVYPIQPIKNKTLAFTIRDLPLPNSEDLDSSSPETIAAALAQAQSTTLSVSSRQTQGRLSVRALLVEQGYSVAARNRVRRSRPGHQTYFAQLEVPSLRAGSRAGSSDSSSSALSGILWHGGGRSEDGRGKGAVDSLRRNAGSMSDLVASSGVSDFIRLLVIKPVPSNMDVDNRGPFHEHRFPLSQDYDNIFISPGVASLYSYEGKSQDTVSSCRSRSVMRLSGAVAGLGKEHKGMVHAESARKKTEKDILRNWKKALTS